MLFHVTGFLYIAYLLGTTTWHPSKGSVTLSQSIFKETALLDQVLISMWQILDSMLYKPHAYTYVVLEIFYHNQTNYKEN